MYETIRNIQTFQEKLLSLQIPLNVSRGWNYLISHCLVNDCPRKGVPK